MSEHDIVAEYDLVVAGSGGAGMTAALTGAIRGLSVLVIEKADVIGGTTALSAGSIWIPNTHHAAPGSDSFEQALTYLQATVGNYSPQQLKTAFLKKGPEMVRLLEEQSDVKLRAYAYHPDYLADAEGATLSGRVLEPLPFDGRRLGEDFVRLRTPLPEFTLFGGMMVDRNDIRHLLSCTHSLQSASHTATLLGRYARDRLRYRRGTRLVMGNALVGRLLYSLRRRGVPVWTGCRLLQLNGGRDRVDGVLIERNGKTMSVPARRGVVLACGGFSHHHQLRAELLPQPLAEYSTVPADNSGEGVELGMAAGGRLGSGHAENSFWAPVSVRQRRDGSTAVFPHFVLDRGKPGLIAVNSAGQRFVNEATSYQLFSQAIYRSQQDVPTIPCFFICDRAFIANYGLGMIRPRTRQLRSYIAEGYLIESASIAGLAAKIGVAAGQLEQTVARANGFAESGEDRDFGKGSNAYQRNLGDPAHAPNPCLGPIVQAPFYAIRVWPGDIGASCGLVTNTDTQVLNSDGIPITGLYACGNDMNSVMGGIYPAPGITLGPGMTFGYSAAQHAARSND
jgi:succinate dehydrogenase/fumarate reductase flavoprotein subunit